MGSGQALTLAQRHSVAAVSHTHTHTQEVVGGGPVLTLAHTPKLGSGWLSPIPISSPSHTPPRNTSAIAHRCGQALRHSMHSTQLRLSTSWAGWLQRRRGGEHTCALAGQQMASAMLSLPLAQAATSDLLCPAPPCQHIATQCNATLRPPTCTLGSRPSPAPQGPLPAHLSAGQRKTRGNGWLGISERRMQCANSRRHCWPCICTGQRWQHPRSNGTSCMCWSTLPAEPAAPSLTAWQRGHSCRRWGTGTCIGGGGGVSNRPAPTPPNCKCSDL